MSPDGATVTNLNATENVQVDLPPEGDAPARRIRPRRSPRPARRARACRTRPSAAMSTTAKRARRAATLPAVDRAARSLHADRRHQAGFRRARAGGLPRQRALHRRPAGRGRCPARALPRRSRPDRSVARRRRSRARRRASATAGSPSKRAPSSSRSARGSSRPIPSVRSSMLPQRPARQTAAAAPGSQSGPSAAAPASGRQRVPSMLKQDQPVNVTSNRLEYDGAAGHAVYNGNARLWQGDTKVDGDTIVVDDKTGNLDGARRTCAPTMMLDEVDPKTEVRKTTPSTGRRRYVRLRRREAAGDLHGARRTSIGTAGRRDGGQASSSSSTEDGNELERAEGYGANGRRREGERPRRDRRAPDLHGRRRRVSHDRARRSRSIEKHADRTARNRSAPSLTFQRCGRHRAR